MFLLERVLGLYGVGRDSQNIRASLVEIRAQPREVDGFAGTTRGVGLGIEIDDELATLELGQRNAAAAVTRQRKCGGFLTHRELDRHWRLPFVPFSRLI